MNLFERQIESPVGRLRLLATDDVIVGLYMPGNKGQSRFRGRDGSQHRILRVACTQLAEYFAGERMEFDLPLRLEGTEFQRAVWSALQRIPFGETRTYSKIATQLGRSRAVRAVGAANARNPVSIIVPCHRVIGVDGTLAGYAGGTERKRWLLQHERCVRGRL